MFNHNGVWQQQIVHEGTTRSGQRGLFTGGYLALPLRVGEDAAEAARRCGFIMAPSEAHPDFGGPQ